MNIKEMSAENRPRERLVRNPNDLSPAELFAILLKSGTQRENVLEIAQRLLSKYGFEGLSRSSVQELSQEYGIGLAKACQIVAVFEFYRRIPQRSVKEEIFSAADVARLYLPRMNHLQKEHFLAVYLDTKNKIIAEQTISVGILNASLVHPREVFYGAIKNLAHSVIVLHNHPSGDPQPSAEDLRVTKALRDTGKIMGIHFLDHVIIGMDQWWSWAEMSQKGMVSAKEAGKSNNLCVPIS